MHSQYGSRISVVIPSAEAPEVFEEVLASLCKQDPSPMEILVIDDAMDENAHRIVDNFSQTFPVRTVKNSGRGVSAARNTGAGIAQGDNLVFIDTDVIVKPGAFRAVEDTLLQHPEYDGVVGVQSRDLRYNDFFSRWKNHWMRYTYRRLQGNLHLFYTSCAAIRKQTFEKSGGFDTSYCLPSIEDTAFGRVLGEMGARIFPLPEFEVEHVKSYSFRSVLSTDCRRSRSLVRYALRNFASGKGSGTSQTSVPGSFMIGTACMAFFWIFLVAGSFLNPSWFRLSVAMLTAFWVVNGSWLIYLLREEGSVFFIKSLFFLPVDASSVILGIIRGIAGYLSGFRY